MIYRFRVILDAKEDVFRDIEIYQDDSLEDLHEVIVRSFKLTGKEMASFYMSDEDWNQGEEIPLFDMSDGGNQVRTMSQCQIDEFFTAPHQRMLYVYDFMNMKTFYVELFTLKEPEPAVTYPIVAYSYGDAANIFAGDEDFDQIEDPDELIYDDEELDSYGDDIFAGDDEFGQAGYVDDDSENY